MDRPNLRRWDRHQWASGAAETRDDVTAWNLIQWVGDRPGAGREPIVVEVDQDGLFRGFSGFGVSDSGGQRWASESATASRLNDTAESPATPGQGRVASGSASTWRTASSSDG